MGYLIYRGRRSGLAHCAMSGDADPDYTDAKTPGHHLPTVPRCPDMTPGQYPLPTFTRRPDTLTNPTPLFETLLRRFFEYV